MSEPADHVGGAGTTCKRRQDVSDVGLEAWKLLFRLFGAEKGLIHAAWARLPLTPRQAILLWHIEPGNPVPMNQLASALDCDASNVTVLVDKLEALKLIGRQAHEKDRRVKIIALTERGKAMRAALLESISEVPSSIRSLPEFEQHALRDILQKAIENRVQRLESKSARRKPRLRGMIPSNGQSVSSADV